MLGSRVSNGVFRLRLPRSPFLLRAMDLFSSSFLPSVWTSGGAEVLTRAMRERCGVEEGEVRPLTGEDEKKGFSKKKTKYSTRIKNASSRIFVWLYGEKNCVLK